MSEELLETTPTPEQPAKRTRRVTRRTALKTGAAVAAGVAMAGYVKPSFDSVGVQEAYAFSAGDFPPCENGDCYEGKVSISVDKDITSLTFEGGKYHLKGTIEIISGADQTLPAWVVYWADTVQYTTGGGVWSTLAPFSSGSNSSLIPGLLDGGAAPGTSSTFNYDLVFSTLPAGTTSLRNRIEVTIYQGNNNPYHNMDSIEASSLVVVASNVPVTNV